MKMSVSIYISWYILASTSSVHSQAKSSLVDCIIKSDAAQFGAQHTFFNAVVGVT